MKKSLFVLITLLLVILLAGTASAEVKERDVNLVIGSSQAQINDQSVTMSAPAVEVDGRTLVPLRFISEAFGCDVQWNGDLNTATVTLVDQIIEVPVGKNYAVINGGKTDVLVPAQLINDRTYVPLRFISENLGAKVDYNANTSAISISLKKYFEKDGVFEMVLPVDWVMDSEATKEVKISANKTCYGDVIFASNGDSLNTDNFNIFAEDSFKKYATKDIVAKFIKGVNAVIIYREGGLINVHSYKLLKDGIYFSVFAAPEASFDTNLAGQIDIVINTLKSVK